MTPERWQIARILFEEALALPATKRLTFLEEKCASDQELIKVVSNLLLAADQAVEFIERPISLPESKLIYANLFGGADRLETEELPSPLKTLQPGDLLQDRYQIEDELGRGGFGIVYKALDLRLKGRPVAVKLLNLAVGQKDRAWYTKKFQGEIEALTRIDHPGIVQILDWGILPDERSYFVMQFIEGLPLRTLLQEGKVELHRIGQIMLEIGRALSAAHNRKVIHRDLKPENVMLQQSSGGLFVKLIDFGIASILHSSTLTEGVNTRVVGSLAYISPEQLQGTPVIASDIYAMGVMAYEMVTGRKPFPAGNSRELFEAQYAGVKVSPRELRAELPEKAEQAILKALQFHLRDRYSSALDLGNDLFLALTAPHYQATHPLSASSISPPPAVPDTAPMTNQADSATLKRPAPHSVELESPVAPSIIKPINPWRPRLLWLALSLLVVLGAFFLLRQTSLPQQPPPQTINERILDYSLSVRSNPKLFPKQKSFDLLPENGTLIYGQGDSIRFNVTSSQDGFLYILNEAPDSTAPLPHILLESPFSVTNDEPSAFLQAHQRLTIPQTDDPQYWGFQFDSAEGTEKFWLVWATQPIPELEAAKPYAWAGRKLNPARPGWISDLQQAQSIQRFLLGRSANNVSSERLPTGTYSRLYCRDNILVYSIRLEHRR